MSSETPTYNRETAADHLFRAKQTLQKRGIIANDGSGNVHVEAAIRLLTLALEGRLKLTEPRASWWKE
jgi:hypothetical protein